MMMNKMSSWDDLADDCLNKSGAVDAADINRKINSVRSNGRDYRIPALPDNRFSIIYADPPWDYKGKMQYSRPAFDGDPTAVATSAAIWQYPTLPTRELAKIPVEFIAEDDALLFMWATSPFLDQAIELGAAWGFDYKTVAFVWDKLKHNPGRYTISQCELCLVFKRGRIPGPRGITNARQLVRHQREQHSKKPDCVRDTIAKMFPWHNRVELFARGGVAKDGWTFWGNQWDEMN